jgi:hypothetical protein
MPSRWKTLSRPFARICPWSVSAVFLAVTLTGNAARAGLNFNVTFDSSVNSAPVGFTSAFNTAIQILQSTYNDNITINMNVGFGEINGNPLSPGNLGQSSTFQQGFFTYNQIRTALTNDATSATDATAVAHLPAADPTGGANFVMSNAEAKALGLLAANATGTDGFVGFSSTAAFTYDPNNRAVAGKFDFIGVALHEITEVMGRYGLTQNGAASGRYSPIDLFRYTSPGNLGLTPVNGTYFSIDGGTTTINTFNGTGGGDLSDWKGDTRDSLNASSASGVLNPFSAGDIQVMDAIGYNLIPTAVPEPSSLTLVASAAALGLGVCLRRRKTGVA